VVLAKKKTKPKSISTIEIEIALSKHFGVQKNIIVPNISWGFLSHEMDLAIISKSGYLTEIEIKISKSDFLKDFQKQHNHIDKQNRISHFYFAMPKIIYDKVSDKIPEHAGVIICDRKKHKKWNGEKYVDNEYIDIEIVKNAIKIKNARKLTIEEQFIISKLGCMRIFNLKTKIVTLQNKNKNDPK